MDGLTNNTAVVYRFTKAETYPYDKVWAVAATLPAYVSSRTKDMIQSDGTMVYVQITRVRTAPYTWVKGDRVYLDSHIYETLSYENFDGLDMEAVTICKILDDSFKTAMGDVF